MQLPMQQSWQKFKEIVQNGAPNCSVQVFLKKIVKQNCRMFFRIFLQLAVYSVKLTKYINIFGFFIVARR